MPAYTCLSCPCHPSPRLMSHKCPPMPVFYLGRGGGSEARGKTQRWDTASALWQFTGCIFSSLLPRRREKLISKSCWAKDPRATATQGSCCLHSWFHISPIPSAQHSVHKHVCAPARRQLRDRVRQKWRQPLEICKEMMMPSAPEHPELCPAPWPWPQALVP